MRRFMQPIWRVLGVVTSCLCGAAPAGAAPPGSQDTPSMLTYQPPKTQRRDGFSVGVSVGAGAASYAGYPNFAGQIGDPAYLASSGLLFGHSVIFWGGGALRDWLTVGLGASITGAGAGSTRGGIASAILHLEVFPFFPWGGAYQDLGLSFDGGVGGGSLLQSSYSAAPLPAGATSHVAVTAFYEPFRFGPFSTGPTLTYAHDFSQTMLVHQVTLGLRCAGYGKQPKKTAAPPRDSARSDSARTRPPRSGASPSGSHPHG